MCTQEILRTCSIKGLLFLVLVIVGCAKNEGLNATAHCLNDRECSDSRLCHPTQHVCVTETEYMDVGPPSIPQDDPDVQPIVSLPQDMAIKVDAVSIALDTSVPQDAIPTIDGGVPMIDDAASPEQMDAMLGSDSALSSDSGSLDDALTPIDAGPGGPMDAMLDSDSALSSDGGSMNDSVVSVDAAPENPMDAAPSLSDGSQN